MTTSSRIVDNVIVKRNPCQRVHAQAEYRHAKASQGLDIAICTLTRRESDDTPIPTKAEVALDVIERKQKVSS